MTGALRLVKRDEEVPCLSCGSTDAEPVTESPAQMSDSRELFRFVRCRACQLIRLSPRVSAEDIGRFYDETYLPHRGPAAWGRYAHLVEKAQRGTDRARVRRVLSARRLTSESRVLDVGCGLPTFLRLMKAQTGAAATGVDFSDEAWKHDPAHWAGLELKHGTLEAVALTPGYDAITLWHALEHEYDPLATLKHLRALAKQGGVLVVEVPNYDSLTRRLHGSHWAGWHTPRHTAAYTPATLAALLERAGWRVQRQLRHGTLDPYVLWWLGQQERLGRNVRVDLSDRFVPFVLGKIATWPIVALQRWLSLGVQTAIATAAP